MPVLLASSGCGSRTGLRGDARREGLPWQGRIDRGDHAGRETERGRGNLPLMGREDNFGPAVGGRVFLPALLQVLLCAYTRDHDGPSVRAAFISEVFDSAALGRGNKQPNRAIHPYPAGPGPTRPTNSWGTARHGTAGPVDLDSMMP